MRRAFFAFSFAVSSACAPLAGADLGDALSLEAEEGACSSDDPRVGETFPLDGHFHGVAGTLTVIDDCTLEVSAFAFDGGGLDVRAIVASDEDALADDAARTILSEDLRRPGGYADATLRFALPKGAALADVGAFSIWCVPASANLGHTLL